MLLAAALLGAGCSSSEGDTVAPTSSSTTTTTISLQQCEDAADEAIVPLEDFIAEHEDLTPQEWNELDPPPSVQAAQDEMVAIAQAAVDRGCDPTGMEELLQERVAELEGNGEVGRAIAAALRGEGPILGPPAPILPTTVPRDTEASTVQFERGDDLRAILAQIAPGSTIEFPAGTFEFTESIVVDIDVTFRGAGRDRTLISSSAEGVAVAFIGPGGFALSDMAIEHTGASEASVLLAIEGPLRITGVELRGGRAGEAEAGGGHGLVLAYEPLEGFPVRTQLERSGEIVIRDTWIRSNDAAGILVNGDAAPRIADSQIEGNGGCGVCLTSTSSGEVRATTIDDNQIGVQVTDTATVRLDGVEVTGSTAVGVTADGESRVTLTASSVRENADVGIQANGDAELTVEQSTIAQQQVGLLAAGTSEVRLADSSVETHAIGIQVGGEAAVESIGNTVRASLSAAINYGDDSGGRIVDNEVSQAPEVAIQVGGRSAPEISGNTVSTAGAAGISVVDEAAPSITGNEIRDRDVGMQVGGSGTPQIRDNALVSGGGLAINILETSGAVVTGNLIEGYALGIQAGGTGVPEIRDNALVSGGQLAINMLEGSRATVTGNEIDGYDIGIQVGGSAAPNIENNVVSASTTVGILFGETSSGRAAGNTIRQSATAAIAVGGQATPAIESNELSQNGVGIVYREQAAGSARSNNITEQSVGMQIGDGASPLVIRNVISTSAEVGLIVSGTSTARVQENILVDHANISLQVGESARPDIAGNEIQGRGIYGLVMRDAAAGRFRNNIVSDHIYGAEIRDTAAPAITGNQFVNVALTSISYSGSAGGAVSGNQCPERSLTTGIVITDSAAPDVGDNACTVGSGGITPIG